MKTKKIFLMLPFLFLIIGVGGCKEDEPQYEIYENHDITACGVEDPLRNIKWLMEFCNEHSQAHSVEVFLYKHKNMDDNHIIINTATEFQKDRSPAIIYTRSVYSCKGELLLFYGTEGMVPDGWNEFFENNQSTGLIWSIKAISLPSNSHNL